MLKHFTERKRQTKKTSHCVCINLKTGAVWCYACDEELYPYETEDSGLSKSVAAKFQEIIPLMVNCLNLNLIF